MSAFDLVNTGRKLGGEIPFASKKHKLFISMEQRGTFDKELSIITLRLNDIEPTTKHRYWLTLGIVSRLRGMTA